MTLHGVLRHAIDVNVSDNGRGIILERILRQLVFEQKSKFPELKTSALIKDWERTTGQKW